ncbi:glutathione S-transferase N-terminal domain-containing protein [Sinimarinibacterium thermocellulolyticum]|uniref:Glutathione S-transferase N-terminal domain-containing protein n=1 Tax=Sinimarinibacterium thermocellulolyticum TaxID=3170016 RepID=A0ABV2A701_9GAMM
MAIPAKSKYVIDAKPAARAGLTLFCAPADFACLWVRIILAEKDVDHARIEWVQRGRPHQDLLLINPSSSLPTLADRDAVLHPASIIAEYLDERYPHPRMMPPDPAARARLRMLLIQLDRSLLPLAQAIVDAPRAAESKTARKQLAEQILASRGLFPQRGWCLGLDFSLADCAWAALFSQLGALQLKLPADPALLRYAQRLLGRPSVQSCLRT